MNEEQWQEYRVLEARTQNDSRIAYGFVGVLTAGAITTLGVYLTYVLLRGGGNELAKEDLVISYPLGAASLLMLAFGYWILKRFDENSSIRVARAVQIERQLRFHSFLLLPPWEELPPDSNDFVLTLGELVTRTNRESTDPNKLVAAGKKRRETVRKGYGVTRRYLFFALTMTVLWILIGILVWLRGP